MSRDGDELSVQFLYLVTCVIVISAGHTQRDSWNCCESLSLRCAASYCCALQCSSSLGSVVRLLVRASGTPGCRPTAVAHSLWARRVTVLQYCTLRGVKPNCRPIVPTTHHASTQTGFLASLAQLELYLHFRPSNVPCGCRCWAWTAKVFVYP